MSPCPIAISGEKSAEFALQSSACQSVPLCTKSVVLQHFQTPWRVLDVLRDFRSRPTYFQNLLRSKSRPEGRRDDHDLEIRPHPLILLILSLVIIGILSWPPKHHLPCPGRDSCNARWLSTDTRSSTPARSSFRLRSASSMMRVAGNSGHQEFLGGAVQSRLMVDGVVSVDP